MVYEYICWNEIFVDMDKMLEKFKEQEAMIIKKDKQYLQEGKIKLSPKIDVEECLRNGGITADDYRKTHQV